MVVVVGVGSRRWRVGCRLVVAVGGYWWWVGGGEWWRKIASKNHLWQTGRRTLSHIELLLQLKRGLVCHNIKMSRHNLRV